LRFKFNVYRYNVGLAADGSCIDMEELRAAVSDKTALIATAHVSNVLGCELDVPAVVKLARRGAVYKLGNPAGPIA
jgi:selenocysteine lyase/cysteine desulfurase